MSPGCQRFLFQSNCRWARWAGWKLLTSPLHISHGDRHCRDRDHQYDSQGSCWVGFVLIISNSRDIISQNSVNSFCFTSIFHVEGSKLTAFSLHIPAAAKHFHRAQLTRNLKVLHQPGQSHQNEMLPFCQKKYIPLCDYWTFHNLHFRCFAVVEGSNGIIIMRQCGLLDTSQTNSGLQPLFLNDIVAWYKPKYTLRFPHDPIAGVKFLWPSIVFVPMS